MSGHRVLIEFDVRLGDFVVELPILHALRDKLDSLKLEAIVHARCAGLLEDYGWIRRVHVKDETYRSQSDAILSSLREPFDLFLYIRRNPAIKATRLLVRARRKVGAEHFDPALHAAGVIRHRYSILRALFTDNLPEPRTRVELEPRRATEAMSEAGLRPDGRILCVGPGASTPLRRWPLDRFIELVRTLRPRFDAVAVLGSPAEADVCRQLADDTDGTNLTRFELVHTAALLSKASLYLGNDSGLSHLAAAQGCPAVSIGLKWDYYLPWNGYGIKGDLVQMTVRDVGDFLRKESLV